MADPKGVAGEGDGAVVDPPRSLVAALRRLLRPLVRALVHQQVQYPQLASLLKSLYIEVARSEFSLDGKGMTLSRLSLLTGIHRREAKNLSKEAALPDAPPPRAVGLGAQIIARWTGGSPWVDEDGRPRPLPRADESDSDFQALVRSVSVDIHPRSVLDEWRRLGVAELDAADRVTLRTAAFVPARGYDEKAHYVGRNLRDHLSAGFENLAAEEAPHFERAVYYVELPEAAVAELEALARDLGQQTLERVNARARELKEAASKTPARKRGCRFTFGIYVYEAPASGDSSGEDRDEQGDADA